MIFGIKFRWEHGLILCLLIVTLLQKYSFNKRFKSLNNELTEKVLANQKLDSIKNRLGQTVYEQDAIITSNQDELKKLTDEKFQLQRKHEKKIKEVTLYYESKLKVKVDSVFVPYKDTSELRKFKDSAEMYRYLLDSTIKVPKLVLLDSTSEHYQNGLRFEGEIQKKGFKIQTVSIIDTQYIRVNRVKRNFWKSVTFKPRKFEVQVLHTSPYMQVQGQNSVIYQPAKKANILLKVIEIGGLIYLGSRL